MTLTLVILYERLGNLCSRFAGPWRGQAGEGTEYKMVQAIDKFPFAGQM